MNPNAQEIVRDPNWYLHAIDLDQATCQFVKTNAHSLSECSFLDHRFETAGLATAVVSFNKLRALESSINSKPPNFVFHTAFCCSTLLARCLDLPGANVSLKEPAVLMALANYQRTGHRLLRNPTHAKMIYSIVSKLLFRPFGNGQQVLVKPTNPVNNIILPLLASHPQSRALLLHSDLESFLISNLKKGQEGRSFARRLFTIFLMDSFEARQLDTTQLLRMTDSQIAAIAWHLQLEHFFDATQAFPSQQVRSLHCDSFLARPETTLRSVIDHFQIDALSKNFDSLVQNAPLKSNAKMPGQTFNNDNRIQEYEQARDHFSDDLEVILPWAKTLEFRYRYSDKVANPL